jgi:hypothetical protein
MDLHANLAHSTLASAPDGTSGTSLTVGTGHGARFPAAPFNVLIWPADTNPLYTNAEIVRVTNKATDTFTVTRAQEGTSARTFSANDNIALTVTKKMLNDAEFGAGIRVNPLHPDYGAVGDGATDDGPALAAAWTAAQAAGLALFIPLGFTFLCSTWTTVVATADVSIYGGGTIKWGGGSNKSFMRCPVNVTLSDVTFDGWSRVVDNETGVVTDSIDYVRAHHCTFKNATAVSSNFCQQILVQNQFEEVTVEDCRFENCVYTAFQTGDNVYADQDKWKRVNFNRNRVLDVDMIGSTAAVGYGVLIYGMDVSVNGNDIEDVDGPTAATSSSSNGASGIYTKARYNQIIGNRVKRIGVNTACASADGSVGIHIKGSDRSVTSSPQGYDVVCTGNVVRTVGVSNTHGYGIAALHSDVNVSHNIVEEFGTIGVVLADAVTGATGSTIISHNLIRQAAGASTIGINSVNASASRVVIQGNALKVPAIGIYVRNVSWNIANVIVADNNLDCGTIAIAFSVADGTTLTKTKVRGNFASTCTYGVYFTYGTGTFATIDVEDNDFTSASTAGISGTGAAIPSGVRIRRNRGFVTENGGTSSGKSTGQTIAHGLAAAPTVFSAVPQATAATDVYVTADATNLTVTFGGGGTVAFAWEAKTAHHYA